MQLGTEATCIACTVHWVQSPAQKRKNIYANIWTCYSTQAQMTCKGVIQYVSPPLKQREFNCVWGTQETSTLFPNFFFFFRESGMVEENHTMKHEFILTGFTDYPEMKALLFVVFFVIYLITMVGNMGLMILISKERSLHTPMYIFLGNLALVDSCCACAITPKMLGNFFLGTE